MIGNTKSRTGGFAQTGDHVGGTVAADLFRDVSEALLGVVSGIKRIKA